MYTVNPVCVVIQTQTTAYIQSRSSCHDTARICYRLSGDLLQRRSFSKSKCRKSTAANPLCVAGKSTAFCHRRICLNYLGKPRCVAASLYIAIRSMWLRTEKSTASLQHAAAKLQRVSSKSVKYCFTFDSCSI